MNLWKDLSLLFVNIGAWGAYLFIVGYIRKNSDGEINNYNILNLPRTYKLYFAARKENKQSIGILFYFHIVTFLAILLLAVLDITGIIKIS